MPSWCWIVRAYSTAAIGCFLLASSGCASKTLPELGVVSAFQLTSQDGTQFASSSLKGSVWVADFFFTNCTGPCPRMSSQMHKIQNTFPGQNDLKLVSITVDPQRDTPLVMANYAKKFSAEPGRWTFLTGPMPELNRLCRDVFMLGEVDGKLDHSTRFVLVDREGRIRGFYLTSEPEAIPQLIDDIKVLLKEHA